MITKSWKLADCELKTNNEYNTVTKISRDITCTKPLIVAIIAYLEWLNKPTIEKKMFENKIKTKWYNIIESTLSTINILGPQIKFKLKTNCVENSNDKKIGAATVVGRGIKKISFESILKRSAKIWKAPFLPIMVGPILRCANANIFLSVSTINKTVKTHVKANNNANSCIVF